MARSMGIGELGQRGVIIKRKFRYVLSWDIGPEGSEITVPQHFVKVANRPQLDVGETEINFLNAVTWIPGKGRWQPMSVSYYDVTHEEMANLYTWIGHVYNFQLYGEKGDHLPQSEKEGYAATGTLKILDGCGNDIEHWELYDCWPQSVNWGDLDYESSDACTIDLTIRYSRAKLINTTCMKVPTTECIGCTT